MIKKVFRYFPTCVGVDLLNQGDQNVLDEVTSGKDIGHNYKLAAM